MTNTTSSEPPSRSPGDDARKLEQDLAHIVPAQLAGLRELLAYVESGFEEEKRGLARRLHGEIGSSLSGLSMHLTLLGQKLPEDAALRERLGKMKTLLQTVTESTRSLERGLRPEKLDVFGLKVALGDMAQAFQEANGCECRVSLPDEELSYTPGQELAMMRMVEEALANVRLHANASRVDIILDDMDDEITLTIRDNGRGIAPEQIAGAGKHGLRLLRERVAGLDGSLSVSTPKGAGTVLAVSLPKTAAK